MTNFTVALMDSCRASPSGARASQKVGYRFAFVVPTITQERPGDSTDLE